MILLLATTPDAVLGVDTALLIILAVGFAILAHTVFQLRRQVASLTGKPGTPSPPAKPPLPGPVALTSRVHAAIAAAIFASLGPGHRVVSISNAPDLMWSREGRRQVFLSHRLR